MMGSLGASTLAGGGLTAITLMTLLNTVGGVLMGASPLIAEAYGADRKYRLQQLTCQGLWLVFLLTIPLAIAISAADSAMISLGQAESTVALANSYLDIMVWGCFPALGFMLLRGIISSLDCPRPVTIVVVMGTIFNIAGNYILAFGKFGLPRLEIAGLAIATVITFWGMFLALLFYMMRHPRLKTYRLFDGLFRLQPSILGELIKLGLPIGIFIALESGLFTVISYLAGILGTEVLAAHQIVLQTMVVIFMIPLGISYAATVRVGQWLGKQDFTGIKQAGYVSIAVGLLFNSAIAIALLLFPRSVIGLYLDLQDPANQVVIAIAIPILAIASVAQIVDGMQKIVCGILQGLQDTKIPMLLSIPAFWGVGLSLSYFMGFYLNWGAVGLWIGQSIGLAIAATIFTLRLIIAIEKYKTL